MWWVCFREDAWRIVVFLLEKGGQSILGPVKRGPRASEGAWLERGYATERGFVLLYASETGSIYFHQSTLRLTRTSCLHSQTHTPSGAHQFQQRQRQR